MKKLLCIVLAMLLCLPLLVACGKQDSPADDKTSAEQGNGNTDDEAARQAAAEAAKQTADKQAIAAAFNAKMTLPQIFPDAEVNPDDPDAAGEPFEATPLDLAETLLSTVEMLTKMVTAETKFDLDFFTTFHVLFAMKDGVVYGNVNGDPVWISLTDGVATLTSGLPLETERLPLLQMLSAQIGSDMMETVDGVELSQEQLQELVNALPELTAADLTAAGNGVYVLTDEYITRLVLAGMNAGMSMAMPEAVEVPAEQAAAAAAEQAQIIAEAVSALGIKIGFKLSGDAISQVSVDFTATEEAVALLNSFDEEDSGMMFEPDAEEEEDEDEDGMPVGTTLHLVVTFNDDGLPTSLALDLAVPGETEETDATLTLRVVCADNNLPTSVELALTAPGDIEATLSMNATYADKALTTFALSVDATVYDNEIEREEVLIADANNSDLIVGRKTARIGADTTVHVEVNFRLADFALTAADGRPVYAEMSTRFANITHTLDHEPVEDFEGLRFEDPDAEMRDPEDSLFTLDSSNNGEGLIRLVVSVEADGKSADIAGLDIRVGSAPNFVAQADSPFVELSEVVEQLLGLKDLDTGVYAYVIDETIYFFTVDTEYNQVPADPTDPYYDPSYPYTWEPELGARFDCCAAVGGEMPYDCYTMIIVDNGDLVLRPIEPVV